MGLEEESMVLVMVNPAAGGGRAGAVWARHRPLARHHLRHLDEIWSTRPGHLTELAAEAVARGVRYLLLVGGDGTLHEVLPAVAGQQTAVGILPCGTGNDFARACGMLWPPRRLLPALAGRRIRPVDLGEVQAGDAPPRLYALVAGAGFNGAVAAAVHGSRRPARGMGPYLLAIVQQAFVFHSAELHVEVDGQALPAGRRLLVDVTNAPAYGGGVRTCPPARIDDGMLHVFAVGEAFGWQTLGLLARVLMGRHLRDSRVTIRPARAVRIQGPRQIPVFADGEPVGGLPARFAVRPGALRMWVPDLGSGEVKNT